QHPESELEIITDGELVVSENDLFPIQYSVALFNQPELPVTVQVLADSDRVDLGAGPGEPITLHFDPDNWTDLKTITVMPLDDNIPNGEIPVRISHEIMDYTGTESPRGVPLEILLKDDETCEELLDGDVNHDLCVNLLDLAIVARDWLECAPCYNQGRTVGYWTFDYDVSTDSSGNGNDLDPIGSPTLVEGKIGNAVELNGSNGYLSGSADALNGSSDYLKVGQTNAGLDFAPDSFSVSVWVKATSVTGQWQGILEYCRKTPDNPAIYGTNWFGAWLSSTGKFHFRVGSDTIDSTQTLDPDRWYLLTAVYNSSNDEMSLYLDGEHDNTEARSIPTYYFTAPSQAKLTVGTAGENEDEYFTGMLDNIRVYNGILSETEIKGLYQRGN
ncbi:MAG: LamG domain-containing protein, partial [Anaerohalosphaera sp.]|nr:LamG domain-containing protein [Anaerohalosphaera sp.]